MLKVLQIQLQQLPMATRFPFRYGIATLTQLPHLVVRAEVEFDAVPGRTGQSVVAGGVSAEGLPPKWFTKNPDSSFQDDDLPQMLQVIRQAAHQATELGWQKSFFHWWRQLYDAQAQWGKRQQLPPLLTGLGVSLVERAILDAFCRAYQVTLHQALQSNLPDIDLAAIRGELTDVQPGKVIPSQPARHVIVRHTVGMADPLTDDEIPADDVTRDGLPHSLTACIREYGLRYFKIKLFGDRDRDHERLKRLAQVFQTEVGSSTRFSLDGNENFDHIGTLRDHWQFHCNDAELKSVFRESLLFVEQPLHRSSALDDEVRRALKAWPDAPPLIIDESDQDLTSLPRALQLGYRGTSHKNCKGILKGLANAATLQLLQQGGRDIILSAEDLGNVGPIALMQDLAVVAALGIGHVERNGHHYFAGLSMFPQQIQQQVLQDYPALYRVSQNGFPTLDISDGRLDLNEVIQTGLGVSNAISAQASEIGQAVSLPA